MSARRNFTDQDYDLLSAYIDSALTETERAALESRLSAEPDLRAELDVLRQNKALLRGLPTIKAPRSFALTPAMVRPSRWLGLPTSTAFSALSAMAAALLILLGAGLLFSQNNRAMMPNTVSQLAADQQEAQAEVANLPTQTALKADDDTAATATALLNLAEPALAERDQTAPVDALPAPSEEIQSGAVAGETVDSFYATGTVDPTLFPPAAAFAIQTTEQEAESPDNVQSAAPVDPPQPQPTGAPATLSATGAIMQFAPPTGTFDEESQAANDAGSSSLFAVTATAGFERAADTPSPAPTMTSMNTATPTTSPTSTPSVTPPATLTPAPSATVTPIATPVPTATSSIGATNLLPLLLLGVGGLLLVVAVVTTWVRRRGR